MSWDYLKKRWTGCILKNWNYLITSQYCIACCHRILQNQKRNIIELYCITPPFVLIFDFIKNIRSSLLLMFFRVWISILKIKIKLYPPSLHLILPFHIQGTKKENILRKTNYQWKCSLIQFKWVMSGILSRVLLFLRLEKYWEGERSWLSFYKDEESGDCVSQRENHPISKRRRLPSEVTRELWLFHIY